MIPELTNGLWLSLFKKSGVSLLLTSDEDSIFTVTLASEPFLNLTDTHDQQLEGRELTACFAPGSAIARLLSIESEVFKAIRQSKTKVQLPPTRFDISNAATGKSTPTWWSVSYESIGSEQSPKHYVLATLMNITCHVMNCNDEKVSLHEKQLDLIYNTINDVVFMLDVETGPRFRFAVMNNSGLQKTGLTAQHIIGKYVEDVIPAESLPLVLKNYKKAIREATSVTWQEISVYPTGKKIGQVTVTPIFNERGECIRMVGTVHDITNQKQHELEIKQVNDERERVIAELDSRNKDLEQFTYIVSHNLRAPVANLLGLSRLFDHANLDNEDNEEIIMGISDSVAKLDMVINDLNSILQIREQNTDQKEWVCVKNLVEDICVSIRDTIQKHKVSIKLNCTETDHIYGIKSYLHSIFYNIILNSIKYRKPDTPPLINIDFSQHEEMVKIIFTDNGKGLDMEKNGPLLFGLYNRFDTTVKGKGLGLYIVKTQVEALEGAITAESELDQGMKFIIKLPVGKPL